MGGALFGFLKTRRELPHQPLKQADPLRGRALVNGNADEFDPAVSAKVGVVLFDERSLTMLAELNFKLFGHQAQFRQTWLRPLRLAS